MWALASLMGIVLLTGGNWSPAFAEDAVKSAETTDVKTDEKKAEEAPAAITAKEWADWKKSTNDFKVGADTVWVLITAFLVFFMNLGFAAVESGMCRAKNCVNILSKNFVVFAVSSVAFWIIGWGLMFGNDGVKEGGWIGTSGLWFVTGTDNSPATLDDYKGDYGAINWTGVPLSAKFFFQLVFTGTAATIVSGPFSTTVAPRKLAAARARASLCETRSIEWTSLKRRANSPS